jgi:hypothetical protein
MTLSIPRHNYEFKFNYDWLIKNARTENNQLIITYDDGFGDNELILNLTNLIDE